MAHDLITVAELEARMKRTLAAGAETDQANAFIADASALVRLIAETDFHDPDTDAEVALPAAIRPVVVAMVRRAIDVPVGAAAGLSSESFPAYSWSGGGAIEGGQPAASIYATRRERGIIREAAGVNGMASVALGSEAEQVEDSEEEVEI
jgi:hypothetical protein